MEYLNKILNQSKLESYSSTANIKGKIEESLKTFYIALQDFCLNLAVAKEITIKPLVINSIANIISLLLRRLWLEVDNPELMIDKIYQYCHQEVKF